MTNFNTLCFTREEDKERLIRGAVCLCPKCRELRSRNKREMTITEKMDAARNKLIERMEGI